MAIRNYFSLFLLLCSASLYGQAPVLNGVMNAYDVRMKQSPQEKVFVHTDKTVYLAGETIWMKLYVIDAASHRPTSISKIGYVELLNGNEPLLQAKVGLIDGNGDGYFLLPSSLASGNYMLRSYTSWMKNFDPALYYEKKISVINTARKVVKEPAEVKQSFSLQLFPEGGNLVQSIPSRVGFQITDEKNSGVSGKGYILGSNNDTAARFETLHSGIGSFDFQPQKGVRYEAVAQTSGGHIVKATMPAAFDQGYVLHVAPASNGITVDVKGTPDAETKAVYLMVVNNRQVNFAAVQTIIGQATRFSVPREKLQPGMNDLILFNADKQPICERFYFLRPANSTHLQLKTDAPEYGKRAAVNIDLVMDEPENDVDYLSASVCRMDSLQTVAEPDLVHYFWLQSELKGFIEAPEYYFGPSTAETDRALDNLMLTHGWRRFDWNALATDKAPSFQFLPEPEGIIVSGKLVEKQSNQPVAGITTYISWPAPASRVANAVSHSDGRLNFLLKHIYGPNELVVQTNSMRDSLYRVEIDPAYSTNFSGHQPGRLQLPERIKDALEYQLLNTQIQHAFYEAQEKQYQLPENLDTTAFYGIPDKRYYLDDYTRFPTMEEVIQEYVNEVRLTKDQNQYHFQVVNLPYKKRFDKDPLVLIDGVPVFDPTKIIRFDPLKIKKIDVMARTYYWGSLITNGIVSYSSYEGNLANFELDPSAVVIQFDGVQLKREFYAPAYPTAAARAGREPDRRTVLTWNPDIKTDDSGKKRLQFYTSDVAGTYQVIVQGISRDGNWISSRTTLIAK